LSDEAKALREALANADDSQLDQFLHGYALGTIAGHLIAAMTPGMRAGFFQSMRAQYPEARVVGGVS